MTNCSKRLTWSEEIKNDPHVKSLDPFGNYIICLICNEYGTGKGQKPLTMRRPFSDTNWKQHKNTSSKHKTALQRMEFETKNNSQKKRKQTQMLTFFTVKKSNVEEKQSTTKSAGSNNHDGSEIITVWQLIVSIRVNVRSSLH